MFGIKDQTLNDIMDNLINQSGQAVKNVCSSGAVNMEAWAKENAPWTDRTGNARRSLKGFEEAAWHKRYIGVSGGMPYSPMLEMLNGKKYSILYPTVMIQTNIILNELADTVIAVKGNRR